MKIPLIAVIGLCLSASIASATVTLSVSGGRIKQSDSSNATSGAWALFVDKDNDGFGNLTASFGSDDADDTLWYRSGFTNFAGNNVSGISASGGFGGTSGAFTLGTNGITAGMSIMLYYVPQVTSNATSLAGGTYYGRYRTSLILDGSTGAFFIPAEGQTFSVFVRTSDNTTPGSLGTTALQANLQVIPEPSSALLLLGAGTMLLARRRRQD